MTIKEFKVKLALGSLSDKYKWKLAWNLNTPIEILTILSTDKNWGIRYRVTENPNTPKKILKKLSTDRDSAVSSCAVHNMNYRGLVIDGK